MELTLIQMAGWMGTGKSTIAHAVGKELGAVVLDHDTTKTAILEAGVSHPPAGAASYRALHALAADVLAQGHSVILDSPSLYANIPEIGSALAAKVGARYVFVECQCPEEIAEERINSRTPRVSQVATVVEARSVRADPLRQPARPDRALILDTTAPAVQSVQSVLAHLANDD